MFHVECEGIDYHCFILPRTDITWRVMITSIINSESYQAIEAPATRETIMWENAIVYINKSSEDGMLIPYLVVEYIETCHRRFMNLLVFS